ncbi:HNH endonuclease, partial [Georgenia sp. 10Sc9-8]|nr:HNH endonuclease [Georgenia halotolerans]
VLRGMDPGASLAAMVEDVMLAHAGEEALVEVVAAAKRLEAWSAARAAQAAAELARRPPMNPTWAVAGEYQELNVAGEELAMRLGVTRTEAREMIQVGHRAFGHGTLVPTGEALVGGGLSWRKACTIVRTLAVHPDPVAWAVQEEVLPGAPLRTPSQLVRDLSKALVAVDPEEADRRHRRASARRYVSRPRPLPDGMAAVTAVLPAPDAVAVDLVLHAAARAARNAGDQRSVGQLRADALSTMAATALEAGCVGQFQQDEGRVHPDDARARHDDGRAHTGDPSPPRTRGRPGPRRRVMPLAARTEVRVTVPLDVLLADTPRSTVPGAPTTGPPVRGPSDKLGDAVQHDGGLMPAVDSPSGAVAHLEGYGPLPPEVARALAQGGAWRRLVTDPLSGGILDVGRRRYRAPDGLARHVRLRDGTCVRPGCTTPAAQCDLDHTVPWAHGGPTAADNLGAMCLRDHRVKSSGAFRVNQVRPGVFEWRTAAGLRYRRNLDGTVEHLTGEERDLGRADPAPF